MSIYEFKSNDVLTNTVIANPKVSFKIYKNNTFINNLKLTTLVDDGYAHIFDTNLPDQSSSIIFSKENQAFWNNDSFQNSSYVFGNTISKKNPLSSSIDIQYLNNLTTSPDYLSFESLKSTLKNYLTENTSTTTASVYNPDSYDKNSNLTIIKIPSLMYGSSLNKGSISLKFFYTGSLIGELQDIKKNGELIQVFPAPEHKEDPIKIAGAVMYNEGFILLSGNWNINSLNTDSYNGTTNPKWIYWGKRNVNNSSFEINFEGISKIYTLTMFATAPRSELNFSSNPTFLDYNDRNNMVDTSSSLEFYEYQYKNIKNTVQTPYENVSGSFKRQIFINKIGIYDKNKNLIAVARISTPVKKTEDREFTFKLKLDT